MEKRGLADKLKELRCLAYEVQQGSCEEYSMLLRTNAVNPNYQVLIPRVRVIT